MNDVDVAVRRGVYTAERAAALAGVPPSTVYYWARRAIVLPSVSAEKLKLWSWADLVALRAVYWLRHPRADEDRKPTAMPVVRRLIAEVEDRAGQLGEAISRNAVILRTDPKGIPYIETDGRLTEGRDQWAQLAAHGLVIDLLSPFTIDQGFRGPHLLRPRAHLRIVPGKLSGEPHIEHTRIETRVVWALSHRGYTVDEIAGMYGEIPVLAVEQALDLERQLEHNTRAA